MLKPWFFAISRWLAAASVVVLAACGGGGGGNQVPPPGPPAQTTFDTSVATVSKVTLDLRPLGAKVEDFPFSFENVVKFHDWASRWAAAQVPSVSYLITGTETKEDVFNGAIFVYRAYTSTEGPAFLGVRVSDTAVFMQTPNRSIAQYGYLADYASVVLGGSGGGTGKAGVFDLSAVLQRLVPDLVNGQLTYLGAEDKETYKPTPAEVTRTCWVSHRLGWFDNKNPTYIPPGCTAPAVDGTLMLSGMCNNDRGQLILLAGRKLWPSFTDPKGWKLAGDLNPKLVDNGDFIEYGDYQPSVVSYDKATGTLTVDFGADCMTGFNQPLTPGPLDFRFESNVEGWGNETKRRHWLEWDGKKHFTKISGIACGQRGQVSVYKPKTMNADGTVKEWQDTPYAWFNVPPDGEANPQWQKGTGIDWYNGPPLIHVPEGEHSIILKC